MKCRRICLALGLAAVATFSGCDSESEAQRALERLVAPLSAYEQQAAIQAICSVTLDRMAHPEDRSNPLEHAAGVARSRYRGGPRSGYAVAHMLAIYGNPKAAKTAETAWNEDSCPTDLGSSGVKPQTGEIGKLFGKVVAKCGWLLSPDISTGFDGSLGTWACSLIRSIRDPTA